MVIPIDITLLDWAAQLQIDFQQTSIPILNDEEQWREWGNHIIQSEPFADNQIPDTALYPDWQSWAMAVYYNMSNEL